MSTALMMGVDIGTTSTKAVVYTTRGEAVSHHAVGYPLLRPGPAAAEQDADEIVRAVCEVIRVSMQGLQHGPHGRREASSGVAADAYELVGVCFSAAMHTLIAMDADGRPLTRSITWADNRAAEWAERIKGRAGAEGLYRRTGTPIHPMSPLVKLAWLHETQPALCAGAARFVGIKEYVFFKLYGQWLVDHSIASATGLLNLATLDWDEEALQVAQVRREQLSRLVPTTHRIVGLPGPIFDALGIDRSTPFIVGANDGVLSNLGVDAIAPGEVAITIGTSGAMRSVVDKPRTDPAGRTFCYALTEHHWVVGGPVNNGGIVLDWLGKEFAADECERAVRLGHDPHAAVMDIASHVAAGAEGLLFHPYLAGERAPLWSADLRGSFFGLAMHHRREHMIRAVLEGVIFNLYSILPAVESLVGTVARIKATGGFARSALWRQMMADVFDREVIAPENIESSALGAAVLGLYALGRIDSLAAVGGMVGATHLHAPNASCAATYRRLLPIFLALPGQLTAQYRQIAAFQQEAGNAAASRPSVA